MSNKLSTQSNSVQSKIYQIRIKGHLDSQWSNWFEGLTIMLEENGETLLTGFVAYQAGLHGLLKSQSFGDISCFSQSSPISGTTVNLFKKGDKK